MGYDTVLYPVLVAKVQVVVDGRAIEVKSAVSDTLPMDILLGKDVPKFYELLRGICKTNEHEDDAMAVLTCTQRQKKEQEVVQGPGVWSQDCQSRGNACIQGRRICRWAGESKTVEKP